MRQVVISRHGAPDVLEMREGPDPTPAAGEVRIRVRAAGINFADVLARLGLYPDAPKPPCVVGYEVSGTIDAVGASVTGFHAGDRVVAMTRFGGYADVVTVPTEQVFHFPDLLSDAEAAAVPVNYLTAAIALGHHRPGGGEEKAALARLLDLVERSGVAPWAGATLYSLALVQARAGRQEEAIRLCERGLERVRATGDRYWEGALLHTMAWGYVETQRPDLAVPLEDGEPEPVHLELVHVEQQRPCETDRIRLEVVAEREVAEHLEERQVAASAADVLEVVVLAARPNALLRRRRPRIVAFLEPEERVLELVHAGVGEEQRRVVVGDDGRTRHERVAVPLDEEVDELLSDLLGGHAREPIR